MSSAKLVTDGVQPEQWRVGCLDIAYDIDPTANSAPVTSFSQTITVRLSILELLIVSFLLLGRNVDAQLLANG
jgi:hypothetical protein